MGSVRPSSGLVSIGRINIFDLENNTRDFGAEGVSQIQLWSTVSFDGDYNSNSLLDGIDLDLHSQAMRDQDLTFDLNNDNIVDIADRSVWVHDLANTFFGDSNLDREFNSGDLTTVFQAGEYEDNITLNSTWAEGDWNGDGDFDSGDLVTAFRDGGYELGPKAAVNAVPEPSSLMLLALGLIRIVRFRRTTRSVTELRRVLAGHNDSWPSCLRSSCDYQAQ